MCLIYSTIFEKINNSVTYLFHDNLMQLNEELTSTENKVAFARQAFNDQVMAYNTYKQTFPPVIFAGAFGHGADATLLEFEDSDAIQAAPKVSF